MKHTHTEVEKERAEKIHCEENGCTRVVAERRADGAIIIRAKHHGETHVTIIEPWPMMKNRVEKIRCDEINCTVIVAERRADGSIVIRARHRGREHVTIIPPWLSTPRQDLAADAVKPETAPDTSILL